VRGNLNVAGASWNIDRDYWIASMFCLFVLMLAFVQD